MPIRASGIVGREEELRSVTQGLNAAQSGCGCALFVTGESGIGKSRLAAEAAGLGHARDMAMMRGRGSSIGPMVPFRSLTEALMSLLRSHGGLDLPALGPYRPALARLIPGWGTPASGEDGGSLVVLAEAVLRLAGLAGREHGCLLILDDMQDFDAETLAVVEYLADNLAGQPVLLLGAVRAEPCAALDLARSAAQRGPAALLELRRLSQGSLRQFAAGCLDIGPDQVPGPVVEQLDASSQGVPQLAWEQLHSMIDDGWLCRDGAGWRVTGPPDTKVPATLARSMARRLDLFAAEARELLLVAAVLGQRFPVAVLQAVTGLDDRTLLRHLYAELTSQLVSVDDQTPDWYTFQHPRLQEVLLTLLPPATRVQLARRTAAAVERIYQGLPGEWCQLAASLHQQAGNTARAGELFAEAGRRALDVGAADSAVSLLDEALTLLDGGQARADAFAALLQALAEAGQVERAVTSAAQLDELSGLLSRPQQARLRTRLAWAATVAGRSADGLAQVEIVRRLLGPDAADGDSAAIDVVAAHLELDLPGPGQVAKAELLARRGAAVAEQAGLPLVACQAWQLLGALTRGRDAGEATGCLEKARQIAVRHDLAIEEIHALIRLGNDDALRDASLDRLHLAQQQAIAAGAITSRYQAEASIAFQHILRADYPAAGALLDQVLEASRRLKLSEVARYALLLKAMLAAHQGQRRGMDSALTELRRWDGDLPLHTPRVYGLARAWCALLEENRPRAHTELGRALAAEQGSPTVFHLTGRYGLHLLLRALDGSLAWPEYQVLTEVPAGRLRWEQQFALLAGAVLAGRDSRHERATALVEQAMAVGAPYPTGRHLGLRLASEAAINDGWGKPVEWLRACDEYFHRLGITRVATACRTQMRLAGAPVGQRRQGVYQIPQPLRTAGITVREYDVLMLVTERLTNREIADRLTLSPRTVEKHVASLISKTGVHDRVALAQLSQPPGR